MTTVYISAHASVDPKAVQARALANGLPLDIVKTAEYGADGSRVVSEFKFKKGGEEYLLEHTVRDQFTIFDRILTEATGRPVQLAELRFVRMEHPADLDTGFGVPPGSVTIDNKVGDIANVWAEIMDNDIY